MILFKVRLQVALSVIFLIVCSGSGFAGDIDWQKIKTLQDMAFVEYVKSLDLKGQAALTFWKNHWIATGCFWLVEMLWKSVDWSGKIPA